MSSAARIYYGAVVAAALCGAVAAACLGDLRDARWGAFAVLTIGMTTAHLRPTLMHRGVALRTSELFIAASAILLPPQLTVAVVAIPFVPQAFVRWRGRVKELFNIANFTISGLAGWATFHALAATLPLDAGPRLLVCGVALAFALPIANHGVLAVMLRLAEGADIREMLTAAEMWLLSLGTAAIGIAAAELWQTTPWAVPFAIAPVLLAFQALSVPRLVEEAATDSKTRLYNAARFSESAALEVARAARAGTEVAAVLVDLDFLRDTNNTYGHLAGDAVLRGVADVIRCNVRGGDVAARFGGEEFAVLLPEATREVALRVAERIRAGVAELAIEWKPGTPPLRATVSVGVACFPQDARDADSLVHAADLALYRAKDAGRNLVAAA